MIVLASATFAEKIHGSEFAQKQIYGTIWFVALWGILVVSALCIFPSVLRISPAFLLHFSMVIILAGAFITFLTAKRGNVHIRQGETVNSFVSEGDAKRLSFPFSVKLLLFDIEYHEDSYQPVDYISFLMVDDEVCRVSMNRIFKRQGYRIYQMEYDIDEMGTTLQIAYDPVGIAVTYLGYILLALSMLWILFLRIKWKKILIITIPLAAIWYYISQLNPMTPVLRSPLLAAHVSIIMVAYLLLLTIMILSIVGLASTKRREKIKKVSSYMLYPAIFLLTAGIFIGAVWANISWGRYWGWDAKETWALITLLVYALPFHSRSLPFFRDTKKFHIYNLTAFITILMTFFGVSFFLGGIHSYV
ncbi:MAG: cytochrome c biogenesis protein CcsA [Prevotellaceae bacterium]|jgi:ABC-type transport system involved in cytochrome c biogenesis permease subunit|nr:cytochrome c biogenesis protein CcsA [Prevotellaceae bacterium]